MKQWICLGLVKSSVMIGGESEWETRQRRSHYVRIPGKLAAAATEHLVSSRCHQLLQTAWCRPL